MNGWSKLAGIILRKKNWFLGIILLLTVFFARQLTKVKLSYESHSILPADHPLVKDYRFFRKIFPTGNSIILLGIKDDRFFEPEVLDAWDDLTGEIRKWPAVKSFIGPTDLPVLRLDRAKKRYVVKPLDFHKPFDRQKAEALRKTLMDSLPFYHGHLINTTSGALAATVLIDPEIANTKKRVKFITKELIPAIRRFEKQTGIKVHTSGLLYIRTLNGLNLRNEIPLYIILTLFVTSFILWFFFRSFPPIFISLIIVSLASVWAVGFMAMLGFKITILTAIIPALIIIIGVPNTIFLINRYQQELISHGNRARSLQRIVTKTGNAVLMTNLTTAMGFATFIIVNNNMLRELGIVASFGIFSIFVLSLLLIPIIFSMMRLPKERYLRHLRKKWILNFIEWLVRTVKWRKVMIFSVTILLIIISAIGLTRIKIAGSILADLPHNKPFYHDIKFFEKEFGGILPLEFMIDMKKPKQVWTQHNLKKMDVFQGQIETFPQLSKPVSVVNIIKFAKQAFYRNKPQYYSLPTMHERNFMLPYIKRSGGKLNLLQSYVDSTGRYARITTYMKDIEIPEMEKLEYYLSLQEKKLFPPGKYHVMMTGKARLFLAGTRYLLNNLFYSLSLAVLLISLVIFFMFHSKKTVVVSMIPNLLPLLFTAGIMGYAGIPLKPSTILIFSITLGISVDDTIHFLTKYREELKKHHWHVPKAVIMALRETGISMFYTSIVLFFGFMVFLISDYGGTKALGGLISTTLLVAMFCNLILLPALLLFLDKIIANKKTLQG